MTTPKCSTVTEGLERVGMGTCPISRVLTVSAGVHTALAAWLSGENWSTLEQKGALLHKVG